MVLALLSQQYGPSAMVLLLWSHCYGLLWSHHYGSTTMVPLLCSHCYSPTTMVPLLWSAIASDLTTYSTWLVSLPYPFQMLNSNQSQYRNTRSNYHKSAKASPPPCPRMLCPPHLNHSVEFSEPAKMTMCHWTFAIAGMYDIMHYCNRLNECNCDCEELGMHHMCIWPPIAWIMSIPTGQLPPHFHIVYMSWSCTDHVPDCLPPPWLTNQCHCITCTLPSNQSANRMMCSTNHRLTCKTVFLRTSPLSYRLNWWTN